MRIKIYAVPMGICDEQYRGHLQRVFQLLASQRFGQNLDLEVAFESLSWEATQMRIVCTELPEFLSDARGWIESTITTTLSEICQIAGIAFPGCAYAWQGLH
jgi:hypothetical protein